MIVKFFPRSFRNAFYLPALFLFCLQALSAIGQTGYSGLRVAVFDLAILQQKNQKLNLRCRMANTGRMPIQGGKHSDEWVVEFDTMGMPGFLHGFESDIAAAVRESAPALRPGELSGPVWLNVKWSPREWKGASGCANLVFDTAFLETWTATSMRVRFRLRNIGSAPAYLFGKNAEPLIKAYFVSAEKLTRGAIPAGISTLKQGRETLDGQVWPGEFVEGFMEVETKNRTRFSPNVALEFDPAQAVDECSRTDNVGLILLQGF